MITNRDKVISIFSDALTAVDSFKFRSRLVWDCYHSLSQLGRINMVTLCWVSGTLELEESRCQIEPNAAATNLVGRQL